ncbi:hypothetical protein BAUCODRAFT_44705, partial [Baudoinia panamericana UAMH 10762]
LLAKPVWSVASLLPSKDAALDLPEVTPKQLHHLLRLSALPPPKDRVEEASMLSTLSSQLHFVKEIQKVETTGIEPLHGLRDETIHGERESELGLAALQSALEQEEVKGRHRRVRRKPSTHAEGGDQQWDPLSTASKTVGRFFVVEGGKDG